MFTNTDADNFIEDALAYNRKQYSKMRTDGIDTYVLNADEYFANADEKQKYIDNLTDIYHKTVDEFVFRNKFLNDSEMIRCQTTCEKLFEKARKAFDNASRAREHMTKKMLARYNILNESR